MTAVGARSSFFYAERDAPVYDLTVRLTDPSYDLVHDVVVDMLTTHRAPALELANRGLPGLIVDVGCGTGVGAIRILKVMPTHQLVCIDSSAAMLNELRRKLIKSYGNDSADGRVTCVCADVRDRGWLLDSIESAPRRQYCGDCVAVVSVYALHHFNPGEKQVIYEEIASVLPAHGIFVNADLFSFQTPWLQKFAQERGEAWISKQFESAPIEVTTGISSAGRDLARLRAAWLRHIRTENHPLPVIAHDKSISEEILLRRGGFKYWECPFRHYQSGVLLATK